MSLCPVMGCLPSSIIKGDCGSTLEPQTSLNTEVESCSAYQAQLSRSYFILCLTAPGGMK